MENLLADLCVEAEAHTLTAMKLAELFNLARLAGIQEGAETKSIGEQENPADLFRIGVAISKYFVTKRLPQFTYEAMEVCMSSD